ncbi:hypothetical protein CF327_g2091 [Tilletia walkeri]|nr:hypothetical protein CF327_g2091 [Tilletia walkeri]
MTDVMPDQKSYASETAFVKEIRKFTGPKGYALVVGNSYKYNNLRTVHFQCDRGGTYRNSHNVNDENRRKNLSSRVSGCRFRVKLQEMADGSFFLYHEKDVTRHKHNHELSSSPTVHPSLRKLDSDAKMEVVRQTSVGITPKQVLTLQDRTENSVSSLPRDIYNISAQARRQATHCLEPPETLLNFLGSENYSVAVRSEPVTISTSRMTGLLFSHPNAISLTKRFHLAITIDATYKTNRYSMPFVHIIGLTATNATFCSAVALVTNEREQDYFWVLNEYKQMMGGDLPIHVLVTDRDAALGLAIPQVFPQAQHNLCRWHLNKNIATNCKSFFSGDAFEDFQKFWSQLVGTKTEPEFESMKEVLFAALSDLPVVIEYIKGLLDLKEQFVSVWADRHLHLGSTSSSRVEGAHRSFKSFLGTSVGDLPLIGRRLHDHLVLQQTQIYHFIENDKRSISVKIGSFSLFAEVRGRISAFALNLAYEQMVIANRFKVFGSAPCTTTFSSSMGISCAHVIESSLTTGAPLSLDFFSKQWMLDAATEPTPLSQRLIAPIRPAASSSSSRINHITGTLRLPSAFERVEAESRPRRPNTCSRCGSNGHNARNILCPARYEQSQPSSSGTNSAMPSLPPHSP